jgi:toxin ParE1/3/4
MAADRRPVIWSLTAREDLREIWDYYSSTATTGIADGVVKRISDACLLLEDHPFAGRSRGELRPQLRSVAATPHVIFYRVASDVVEIVRVLHGRRDVNEIFESNI